MSKVNHTPAPWEYHKEDQRVHVNGDYSKMIADIRGWGWLQKLPDGDKIQDANGRLIAASPDMLEALEKAPIVSKFNTAEAFIEAYNEWVTEYQIPAFKKAKGL